MDEEETGMELVMPFLPVKSKGGPHDDTAYVAGFEMGRLDGLLRAAQFAEVELSGLVPDGGQPIHRENREQADLIAMRYGFIASFGDYDEIEVGEGVVSAWVPTTFRQAKEVQ